MMLPYRSQAFSAPRGSALIMTLIFIVLLTIEAALVMLIITRSAGEEGMLRGQNITARRATEVVIEELQKAIFADLKTGMTSSAILTKYQRGGASTIDDSHALSIVDAGTGTDDTANSNTQISAWVQEYRGNYFHLVGRAQIGNVDLISHKWLLINPCVGGATLTTIATGLNKPGVNAMAVDSAGRVVFGEFEGAGSTLWTWKDGTLTTLLTGVSGIGSYGTLMVDSNDRFYIGQGYDVTGHMYTYKDGVLSTITPSTIAGPGVYWDILRGGMTVDPGNRLYFSSVKTGGRLLTWKNGVLSTILSAGGPWQGVKSNQTDRIYFYAIGGTQMLSWSPATGLSTSGTIVKCGNCSHYALLVDPTGRVNFGDFYRSGSSTNTSRWVWDGVNLTTITAATLDDSVTNNLEHNHSTTIQYFATYPRMYAWTQANGLSTIGGSSGGSHSMALTPGGAAYWGDSWSSTQYYRWHPSTGLSTIMSSRPYPANYRSFALVGERIYFGEAETTNSGNFYTYEGSTGLSTIATGLTHPGRGVPFESNGVAANADGWVLFGENASNKPIRAWKAGAGLSTLMSGLNNPGVGAIMAGGNSSFYFGENNNPGNFYYWSPGGGSCSRGY